MINDTKQPDISVAIPTLNRGEILLDTIRDVLKQSHKNLELIVADQTKKPSADFISKLSQIRDPRLRYYRTGPASLPAARNFILHHAASKIVLFLDDDVELKKDMVKAHLQAFAEHPEVSAVGGRVMQKDFPVKKDVLTFDEFAISHGVFTATEAGYTNAFPGGNHAIRVDDALDAGGYDTRFYGNAFREESDMSIRLSRRGKKIYYEPKAELLHLAAHFGGVESRVKGHIYDNRLFYRNELFFTIRNVRLGLLPRALRKKYREYCQVPGKKVRLKRSYYFMEGLCAAFLRQMFGKQIHMKELSK